MGLLSAIFIFFQTFFSTKKTSKDAESNLSMTLPQRPPSSASDQRSNVDTEASLLSSASESSETISNKSKEKDLFGDYDEKRRCGKFVSDERWENKLHYKQTI